MLESTERHKYKCVYVTCCEKSQIVCTGMYCKEKAIRTAYLFVDKCSTLRRAISEMCKSLACSVSPYHKYITHHLEQCLTCETWWRYLRSWRLDNTMNPNQQLYQWGHLRCLLTQHGNHFSHSWSLLLWPFGLLSTFIYRRKYLQVQWINPALQPGFLFIWLPHYYSDLILVQRKAQWFSYLKWPPH